MARPRVRDIDGSLVGALLGGAIAGAQGAVVGGLLGSSTNKNIPIPLDTALRTALEQRSLASVRIQREAKNRLSIVFASEPEKYWLFVSEVNIEPSWTADDLDDALYDNALAQIDAWMKAHGGG
jgi:hypothetical protein